MAGSTRKIPVLYQANYANVNAPLETHDIVYTFPESGTLVGGHLEVGMSDTTRNLYGVMWADILVLPPNPPAGVAYSSTQAEMQQWGRYRIGHEQHALSASDLLDLTFPINTMRKVFPGYVLLLSWVLPSGMNTAPINDTIFIYVSGDLMFNG